MVLDRRFNWSSDYGLSSFIIRKTYQTKEVKIMLSQSVPFLALFTEDPLQVNVDGVYDPKTQIFEHENGFFASGLTYTDTGGTNDVDSDYVK